MNTAAGIVGDILRIARSIGAKDKGPEALVKGAASGLDLARAGEGVQ